MKKFCFIPARGGSKRLPSKNIIDFCGKPMISYSILAALGSRCFDEVFVSSDDPRCLEIAEKFGAKPIVRNADLATDDARVSEVLLDFLASPLADKYGTGVMCCLFPAAPMRKVRDVQAVVEKIVPGECDFAIAVTEYPLPPHQALVLDGNGSLLPKWPDLVNLRDEDVGRLLVDNGSTYAAYVPSFKERGHFYGNGLKGHVMSRETSVDINTALDLKIATVIAKTQNSDT